MRVRFSLVLLLCVLTMPYENAFAELRGEFSTVVQTDHIEGSQAQSFTRKDLSSVSELRLSQSSVLSENSNFSLDLAARGSNDPNIEADNWSLLNLSARLNSYGNHFAFGSFAPNFTGFTLNQGIIGIGYNRNLNVGQGLSLSAVAGSAASSLSALMKDERTDYNQYTAGLRLSQSFAGGSEAGVSVVNTFDDSNSFSNSTALARKNTVVSGDFNLTPLRRLTISGEIASSLQNYDVNRATSDITPAAFTTDVRYGLGNARFGIKYYRAANSFVPLLGSASPDSEQWRFSWRQILSRRFSGYLNYNLRRNNLDGNLAATTNINAPGFGCEFLVSQPLRLNADIRLENSDTGGQSQTNNSYSVNLNLQKDRASLSLPVEYRSQSATGLPSHTIYVTGLNLSYRLRERELPAFASLNLNRTDDYLDEGGTAGITQSAGAVLGWMLIKNLVLDAAYSINNFRSSLAGSRDSNQNNMRLALNYLFPVSGKTGYTAGVEFSRRELAYIPSNNDDYADNIFAARFAVKF
jgi:hypothetical protein